MPNRHRHRGRFYFSREKEYLHVDKPDASRPSARAKPIRVALAGNPNAGKTSIFNAITGQHQHIGNYPGVTVEKKTGYLTRGGIEIEIVDLPGTYSLSAYSIEEVVTRDFVLREKPDLVVDVLDSANLERNLYLLLQIQELGVPVIGVLNMIDEAEERGLDINEEHLGKLLGIPMVKTIGHRGVGIEELVTRIVRVGMGVDGVNGRRTNYGRELENQRLKLVGKLAEDAEFAKRYSVEWVAIKLLENDEDAEVKVRVHHVNAVDVLDTAKACRDWVERHFHEESPVVVAEQRYAYIHGAVHESVKQRQLKSRIDTTELLDRVALNRFAGLFVFFAIMFLVYQFTFAIGNPLSDLIDRGFASLAEGLSAVLPPGVLRDLLVDGIIGGVGGVLVFFPLVMLLFMGLSILEDTGYMARAAFVMDRFFHLFGLHGRSFIPFMIATGCAVPAVMSARTLVNPRDRIITVLVTPLLMCGAKSPVIAMLAAAFFPAHSALVFWLVWLAGWLIAFIIALVFRKTLFRGEAAPFVMELPPYRMPTLNGIMTHVWERSVLYLRKAGTIILAASIVVWFLLSFPRNAAPAKTTAGLGGERTAVVEMAPEGAGLVDVAPDATANPAVSRRQRLVNSYAGRIGKAVEPILKPAGFDWKIGVALFSGIAAKEVIISTLGILYGVEEVDPNAESAGERTPLKERIARDPGYNPASALAMMFFVLIYFPCIATLTVVKKELGSWKWSAFIAAYTVVVSWVLAFAVYHVALFLGLGA